MRGQTSGAYEAPTVVLNGPVGVETAVAIVVSLGVAFVAFFFLGFGLGLGMAVAFFVGVA